MLGIGLKIQKFMGALAVSVRDCLYFFEPDVDAVRDNEKGNQELISVGGVFVSETSLLGIFEPFDFRNGLCASGFQSGFRLVFGFISHGSLLPPTGSWLHFDGS